MILAAILFVFIFICSAACGIAIAQLTMQRGEGPLPLADARTIVPAAFMAALAIVLERRGASISQLGLIALLGVPFVAAWYADSIQQRIPAIVTTASLALVFGVLLLHHNWFAMISGVVTFAAFAAAAALTKGRGMGWEEAKLAALAGAALSIPSSFIVLAVACLAATVVSVIKNRGTQPIAFAPYIAVTVLGAFGLFVHA
jgi:prepilin signal peptidase PulO-like enzyme (type II secretory pathway)